MGARLSADPFTKGSGNYDDPIVGQPLEPRKVAATKPASSGEIDLPQREAGFTI